MEIEIITPPVADETKPLEHGLVALTEAIDQIDSDKVAHGALGGRHGYGADWDNHVFTMRPFYWGDCDCGFEGRAEIWHSANTHANDCFREELQRRFAKYDEESGYNAIDAATTPPGTIEHGSENTDFGTMHFSKRTKAGEAAHKKWCRAHDKMQKAHDAMTAKLYDECCLKRSPYQWQCTCGVDERAKEYFSTEGHYATCAVVLPNFLHKPSGLEVRWYKWIGRDTEVKGAEGVNLQAMFAECLASLVR